ERSFSAAESLRINIMKRRNLDVAVGEDRAGIAHDLLDLVGGKGAALVELGDVEGEIRGAKADLAVNLGAVDHAGAGEKIVAGPRRALVFREYLQRIEGRIGAGGGVTCGERHLHMHERHGANDV